MRKLRLIIILIFCFTFSCGDNRMDDSEIRKYLDELNELKNVIKNDFQTISNIMEDVAKFTRELYSLSGKNYYFDISIYAINKEGVMYKKKNDGKSAVFVSGYKKIDDNIKNTVLMTEQLDSVFKAVMDYSFNKLDSCIIQIYYNDKNSYHRIYLFLDVIVQYEPRIDITKFNFYYIENEIHNPEKKVVWINEPYVDPAGRGWMIS